jgi:hypothetical protein
MPSSPSDCHTIPLRPSDRQTVPLSGVEDLMARHQIPHGGKGSAADDIAGHAVPHGIKYHMVARDLRQMKLPVASNANRRHALACEALPACHVDIQTCRMCLLFSTNHAAHPISLGIVNHSHGKRVHRQPVFCQHTQFAICPHPTFGSDHVSRLLSTFKNPCPSILESQSVNGVSMPVSANRMAFSSS